VALHIAMVMRRWCGDDAMMLLQRKLRFDFGTVTM
jgi:hypothetical protein